MFNILNNLIGGRGLKGLQGKKSLFLFGSFFKVILTFISVTLIASYLPLNDVGSYYTFIGIITAAGSILNFSINNYFDKTYFLFKKEKKSISSLLGYLLMLITKINLFVWAILFISFFSTNAYGGFEFNSYIIVLIFTFNSYSELVASYYRYEQNLAKYLLISLSQPLIFVGIVFLALIFDQLNINSLYDALLFSYLVKIIFSFLFSYKYLFRRKRINGKELKTLKSFAKNITPKQIPNLIFTQLDKLILLYFISPNDIGVYSIIQRYFWEYIRFWSH